jgi:hypothetical protein
MTLEVQAGPGVSSDLREAIRIVLDRHLSKLGLELAKVSLTEDHDGDPMLLVEAFFSEDNRLPAPDLRRRSSYRDTTGDPVWAARRDLVGAVGPLLPGTFPLLRLRIPDTGALVQRRA